MCLNRRKNIKLYPKWKVTLRQVELLFKIIRFMKKELSVLGKIKSNVQKSP